MMESINIAVLFRASVLLVAGWFFARMAVRLVERIPTENLSAHGKSIVRQIVRYSIYLIFIIMIVRQFGFDLSVLLGTAGILTIAVGFASQTSAANLIAGIFLLAERAFSVGDIIKVGETSGEVLSVDLLSVKLRTFDNLYIRIPNENLMKSTVTTMSKFPIRRYDLKVGIAYKEDIRQARDVLLQVAKDFHLCLDEPAPLVIMQGFGDSSVDLQFSVWGVRQNFLDLRNGIQERVKEAFDREQIEIPFPHRTFYTGSATDPMPIQLSQGMESGKQN
jgi:small-conductance mechanosensitive channel